MARDKGGGDIVSCNIIMTVIKHRITVTIPIPRRTSEIGATHLSVSLTMTDAMTHGLPGHAGVWAGVVGLVTKVLTVLI